jgi:hypothetical protein
MDYYVDRFLAYCPQVDMTQDQINDIKAHHPSPDSYDETISTVSFISFQKNLITSIVKSFAIHQNGSEVKSHAPVIDIDVPCELLPSSQLGHYHFYIHKPITWTSYVAILKAFFDAGIVEEGYYKACLSKGYSAVRLPGVIKPGLKVTNSSILKTNAILRRKLYLAECAYANKSAKLNLLISKLLEFVDGNQISKLLESVGDDTKIEPEPLLVGSSS